MGKERGKQLGWKKIIENFHELEKKIIEKVHEWEKKKMKKQKTNGCLISSLNLEYKKLIKMEFINQERDEEPIDCYTSNNLSHPIATVPII